MSQDNLSQSSEIRFSDEQAMMLETAEVFCRDKSPIDKVRELLADDTGYDPAVWSEIADLGWLGIAVPEEFGGVGLGLAEAVCVVEPMGRHLLATPFVATTIVAQALLRGGTVEQQREWLPRLCAGAPAALALSEEHGDWDLHHLTCRAEQTGDMVKLFGGKTFVGNGDTAEVFLVSVDLAGAPALVLVDASSLPQDALQREVVIDETRRSFRLTLDGVVVPVGNLLDRAKAADCIAYLEQAACLLVSAEICGGMSAVLDLTVEYLNTRRQFDRFIGSYQALKHPMVDVLTAYEGSRSLLYHAATVFDDPAHREVASRMVKAYASDSFAHAGDRAIQFHGAFGFTYECDAQLYLRRALWSQYQFGDGPYHRHKLEDLLL